MSVHYLKCWPSVFEATKRGDKLFEVRSNTDRDFAVGDFLVLQKWDPYRRTAVTTMSRPSAPGAYITEDSEATLNSLEADTIKTLVTFILHGGQFGFPPGICVMSLKRIE